MYESKREAANRQIQPTRQTQPEKCTTTVTNFTAPTVKTRVNTATTTGTMKAKNGSTRGLTEMRFEAINVVVSKQDDEKTDGYHTETGDYLVTGINEDGDVCEVTAKALNLNGFAMATSSMEIGEYGETVVIEQEDGSNYINLEVK